MIKTILVPVTGSACDEPAFAAAFAAAQRFAAHIDFLHVCIDPVEVALAMTSEVGGATLLDGLIEQLERDTREREAKAHRLFETFCTRQGLPTAGAPSDAAAPGPSAEWHVETGQDARWAAAYGMTADLAVAARPLKEAVIGGSVIEALLLQTGRPLLIPAAEPAAAAQAGTVAIAWKATPAAARAVAAAMPFLKSARRIVIIMVEEEGSRDSGERLAANLAWHGIRAETRRLKAKPDIAAQALLAAAAEEAGLLVMGGYGHSRLREWVFGGFTRRVLSDAPLPVLMMH